jgi:hypothetical protein
MIDEVGCSGLIEEALEDIPIVSELWMQDLDGNTTSDRLLNSLVNGAHSSRPDHLEQLIIADDSPDHWPLTLYAGWPSVVDAFSLPLWSQSGTNTDKQQTQLH